MNGLGFEETASLFQWESETHWQWPSAQKINFWMIFFGVAKLLYKPIWQNRNHVEKFLFLSFFR